MRKHGVKFTQQDFLDSAYEVWGDLKALELQGDFAYLNHLEKKEEYLKIISNNQN